MQVANNQQKDTTNWSSNVRNHPHANRGMKMKPPKIEDVKGTLLRLWEYMSRDRRLFFFVILFVVISSALSLVGPYLLGVAVDELVQQSPMEELIRLFILLLVVFVLQSLTSWLQGVWMVSIAQRTIYFMRNDLFSHLQKLPLAFFQTRQYGELMSRVTNDIENVSRTLNSTVIQVLTSVLTIVGTLAAMLWLSPLLTLLTIIIVPLMFMGMKWITNRTGKFFKEQQRHLGQMNGFIEESLSGHTIVKMYSQEAYVMNQFQKQNVALRDASYWAQTYSGFIPKLMNSLNNLSFTIIVGVGAIFAIRFEGLVSIGIIVTFTAYSRQFTRPLNDLANQFNVILSAVAGAERVFQILDERVEEIESDYQAMNEIVGKVEFRDVSFAYEGEQVLKGISFKANPGETIALVGPTGAGKTTIISLISRFYDPVQGQILIDDTDIQTFSKSNLRDQVGVVLQDAHLFETTIWENIRYGRLDATDKEVVEAAKNANAHHFINNLPDGYDTVLYSNGAGISHGQRQLLSIARVLLANPSILILDEATSGIDSITELAINEALSRVMKGRTSFVIAHRLNTVRNADQIFVLQNGRIIERGNHESLMNQAGFYAELVETQTERITNNA
ncbi:ABC transporter ATP-binding protein [Radiobacillus deserti]|uniref:ABC transporter ATP-binding protein n=1 Tax=Radiobacillus deserti TaxID=2594883 RepID=A0A516KLJ0_9BACI|nr:ABC transporter ATP-binding protein [Radiobacillus deserti]